MQMFRLYVSYSPFASSCDRNAYLYQLVREKMNRAVFSCLVTAQTEHQLTLDATTTFKKFMDDAITIASRIQANVVKANTLAPGEKRGAPAPAVPPVKQARTAATMSTQSFGAAAYKSMVNDKLQVLLDRFKRCHICAFFPENVSMAQHNTEETCKATSKDARLEAMKKSLQQGRDPNLLFTQGRAPSSAPSVEK